MKNGKNFPFSLPFILDGATGTELNKRGMKSGDCTEKFVLENPQILTQLQKEYINSGSDAVLAATFGANIPTLLRHGFDVKEYKDICRRLFDITKEAAGDKKVGGDISPTGLMLKPYGETDPEEIYEIYRKQAECLLDCGVDFFFVETMLSAAEARLALMAIRSLSDNIPVFVSLTVNETGRTMNGDSMGASLLCMLPYDVTAFGCNCSIGPDVVSKALKEAAPVAKLYGIPLIAKPNAGMPVQDENGTHFPLTPSDMAEAVDGLTGLGAGIFGGCCGTTPEHIKAIACAARNTGKERFSDTEDIDDGIYVSTSREFSKIDENAEYLKIDSESEDDIYDLLDECDAEDILYFELGSGAGELLVSMDSFIPNPISVRGAEDEIKILERKLCRKVR